MKMSGEQRIAATRQQVWEALNDPAAGGLACVELIGRTCDYKRLARNVDGAAPAVRCPAVPAPACRNALGGWPEAMPPSGARRVVSCAVKQAAFGRALMRSVALLEERHQARQVVRQGAIAVMPGVSADRVTVPTVLEAGRIGGLLEAAIRCM